jgi:hypothetical protein
VTQDRISPEARNRILVDFVVVGRLLGNVHTVLGPQWAASVAPLRLLALAFILRALATVEPIVLVSRREMYLGRNLMALFAVVAPLAFVFFAQWAIWLRAIWPSWIAHPRAANALLRLARRYRSSSVPVPATLSPGSA